MDKNDFQPMPKRFMVWDKIDREFIIINSRSKVGTLEGVVREFQYNPYVLSQCVVVQSTNLFDEDGEEIFEGSVVRDFDDVIGVVYYDMEDGGYRAKSSNGDSFELVGSSCDMKVLGHIFSNPELLEEG